MADPIKPVAPMTTTVAAGVARRIFLAASTIFQMNGLPPVTATAVSVARAGSACALI
jgi:hypothetical protein